MSDVLLGLGLRLRWQRLVRRHDHRVALGLLAMANALFSIGLIALAAKLTHEPLVFPSLGPTAFLLFYRPYATVTSPRNALCGHAIGAAAGLISLWAFGLVHAGPALNHMTLQRVGAAALSLGLTTGGMIWADTPHPPAAATTLIVGLGFLDTPLAVGVLMLGVLLLLMQGFTVNRLAGIDYPLWAAHPRTPHGFTDLRRIRLALGRGDGPSSPTATDGASGGAADDDADGDPDAKPDGSPGGEARVLRYTMLVDTACAEPPTRPALPLLRAALGDAGGVVATRQGWRAVLTVDAVDLVDAVRLIGERVAEADRAVGLTGADLHCWELQDRVRPTFEGAANRVRGGGRRARRGVPPRRPR